MCGTRAGGVGIVLNTLLCLGKLLAGVITGSIAIVPSCDCMARGKDRHKDEA